MGKLLQALLPVAQVAAAFLPFPFNIIASIGIPIIAASLTPKPRQTHADFAAQAQRMSTTVRSPVEPHKVIYGEARVSGPLVFANAPGAANGNFFGVIPLAGHKCEAIEYVYLNDAVENIRESDGLAFFKAGATNGPFSVYGGTVGTGIGLYSLYRYTGDDDQTAEQILIDQNPSQWTTSHRLRGICYIGCRILSEPNSWGGGPPNIAAVVRGRRLYDPRSSRIAITSSSVANPGVFTTGTAHGLAIGDRIFIQGHTGSIPTIRGEFQVGTVPTTTTFTVLGNELSGSIGSSLQIHTGGTGGELTKMLWSDNAALCALDYALAPFGRGFAPDEIDETIVTAAANACDEIVDLTNTSQSFVVLSTTDNTMERNAIIAAPVFIRRGDRIQVSSTGSLPTGLSAATDYYYISKKPIVSNTQGETAGRIQQHVFQLATSLVNARAGTAIDITSTGSGTMTITRTGQPRYTCNGAFTLDQNPREVMRDILSAFGGIFAEAGGKARIRAGVAEAGSPSVTFDEDDLRGEITYQRALPRRDLFNTVRGTFVDPDNAWQPTDFPAITSSTFKTADGGEEIARDIELPFTNDTSMAQRLAKLTLRRSRTGGEVIQFPAKLSGLKAIAGDDVLVSISRLGMTSRLFLCTDWRMVEDMGIDLTLSAIDEANDFTWSAGEAQAPSAPRTVTTPDTVFVPPPGIALTEDTITTTTGELIPRLIVTLTAPADQFIVGYEVDSKLSSASSYSSLGSGAVLIYYQVGVVVGSIYDVRARAVRSNGSKSAYATSSRTIDGPAAGGTNWDSLAGNWDDLVGNWDAL